ncbi:MAG: iron ABC transporter permease [Ruminococcaceae bacterium]|nr:iron ABC transporter permease [Oscillospiraceae bacterium]
MLFNKRKNIVFVSLIILIILTAAISLCIGNFKITPSDLFQYVSAKISGSEYDSSTEAVLLNIRLVRVVAAMVCGAALAVSGAVYQTVFSNNMVSPDLLGVSSSAACGASVAIVLGLSARMNFVVAFLFSIGAFALTGIVSKILKRRDSLLLSGIIVAGFARSGLGLLKYLADSENGQLESIVYWELGSLAKVSWEDIYIIVPFIIVIIAGLYVMRWHIGALVFGEQANLLGVRVKVEKMTAVVLSSLLVALTTAVCGVISWISLIIPLASSELTKSGSIVDNLSISAMLGALFLLVSDDIARAATTSEIPISIMTGAAGLIVFCVCIISGKAEKAK